MQVTELPLDQLQEAPWNPNQMDEPALDRLRESLHRFGLVQNLVVRPTGEEQYEVLSGNQRLHILRGEGYTTVPCVVVELDDARARLLSQALNRIQGEDDLGLRAELVKEVLESVPQGEVLSLLPESAESLSSLSALGEADMAEHLQAWQQAREARLKHMTFQLTDAQQGVVEEALSIAVAKAKELQGDSPNVRGTALYLLCQAYLSQERQE